jgi:hypothetical protein
MKPNSVGRTTFYSEILFLSFALLCAIFCAWSFFKSTTLRTHTRLPASATLVPTPPPNQTVVLQENNSVTAISIGCLTDTVSKSYKTHAKLIALSTAHCKGQPPLTNINGSNQSNSYEIQFMPSPKDQHWLSNYFQLQPGVNRITLALAHKGQKNKTVSFDLIRD